MDNRRGLVPISVTTGEHRAADTPDLTSCDREPIHVPGSVQPHGLLLAVDPETETIVQAAGDPRLLGRSMDTILGRPVAEVCPVDLPSLARQLRGAALAEPLYAGSVAGSAPGEPLDITAHERNGLIVLEVEPAGPTRDSAAGMLGRVRAIGGEMEQAPDLARLCEAAARAVRGLVGYDRVMIYRFLDDGSGCVVAEARAEGLESFQNHHFPASDIPKQARALYLRNLIRVIPDVSYAPAPLVPPLVPGTGRPLDMSDCALRSVSPIHIQYLKNMGVAASMSVSLVRDGALWGLIACHHGAPRGVSYALREACKHVGQILTHQIAAREAAERHAEAVRLAAAREEAVRLLARGDAVEQVLLDHCAALQKVVPATGAAIRCGDAIVSCGRTPPDEAVRALSDWLLQESPAEPYATHALGESYAPGIALAPLASGLLASVVSREEPLVLLWFRAEQVETVNWAGNPHKPAEAGESLGALTPRKSFALWQETVRGRSHAWSLAEIGAARAFREALFEARQHERLRELNVQLRRTLSDKEDLLVQKDLLMREVNHRVQNSLQIVSSMLSLQAREAQPSVKSHFEEARRRIMAVSMVHQRLWRSDQIQTVDFGTYLNELRDALVEAWGGTWQAHLKIHASPVVLPTNEAVVLALVVTELLTNAVKYAYRGEPGPIDVTVRAHGRHAIRVTIADKGIGIQEGARTTGLGSRLVTGLVGQLGGEIEIAANAPGTRVTLAVPCSEHARPA